MVTSRKKFEKVLNAAYSKNSGDRVRQIARIVVENYSDNPEDLVDYFSKGSGLSRGIATAAYAMITNNFAVISNRKYGGLGMCVCSSPVGIVGVKNQYQYVKGRGYAFEGAEGRGSAFEGAEGSGNAFEDAEGSGHAFWGVKGSGHAFRRVRGSENAFEDVSYKETAFRRAIIIKLIRRDE
jgi:hypothetical protein